MRPSNRRAISLVSGILLGPALGCTGGAGGGGTPANHPPVIAGTAADVARAGREYAFQPAATDADGDALTFAVANKPAWAAFDERTGALVGTPDASAVGSYDGVTITVSDGKASASLPPFRIDVLYPPVSRDDIVLAPTATVTPTADGYGLQGDATIQVGDAATQLNGGDLQLQFDRNDDLLTLNGTVDLPPAITDRLAVTSTTRTVVGMYSGAEINARADIGEASIPGIRLRDDFRYLVFFLSESADVTFTGDDSVMTPVTLGLGAAQSLVVTDPTDPFFYAFGYVNGQGYGRGYSAHRQIPFQPTFASSGPDAFPPLESFSGTDVSKGTFPLGFKIVDLLQITGTGVCRPPDAFHSCNLDWTDLATSLALNDGKLTGTQQLKLGFNGDGTLRVSVVGIDLFAYHLLDLSAQLDAGLERQHLALQGVYEPTESQQPVWLPVRPSPAPDHAVIANVALDDDLVNGGDGSYAMELRGWFASSFPAATLQGSMRIDPTGTTLVGRIPDATNPITVSATSGDQLFEAQVGYGADLGPGISQVVDDALGRELDAVNAAYQDLQQKTADYQLEVSLRGVRQLLPGVADAATAVLNGIPANAASAARQAFVDYATHQACVTILLVTTCASDVIDVPTIAGQVYTSVFDEVSGKVAPYKTAMAGMKTAALQADAPGLRDALRQALLTAYDHRTFSARVTRTYAFPLGLGTRTYFDRTFTVTAIPPSDATMIKTAADNVYRIQETSDLMIQAQSVYDALPATSVIEQVREDVAAGTASIPSFDGAGYSVARDGTRSAYVILGGKEYEATFDLLDPGRSIAGIGDAIAGVMTQGI